MKKELSLKSPAPYAVRSVSHHDAETGALVWYVSRSRYNYADAQRRADSAAKSRFAHVVVAPEFSTLEP